MSNWVLTLDQGTTGTTVLVVELAVDRPAKVISRGYAEFPQHFPKPGWVEHDLMEIWRSVETALAQALDGIDRNAIAAIGITNQRETCALWDTESRPVHRALVWQDRRTAARTAQMKTEGHEDYLRERTGLLADPYFSGTKLAWLLDHVDGARDRAARGELRFGTIDTWLIWKLTGGERCVTDATNAGRTLLFDIHRLVWDDELLELNGSIPRSVLPEVVKSSGIVGSTKGVSVLPDGIPIAGIAGDQHAATFGQICFEVGEAKCTYGTGAFVLVNTGKHPVLSQHGLLTTLAWWIDEEPSYALEGSIFVAGAVVQWLRDQLGFVERSSDIEALARQVEHTEGVYLVPALTGLGAPHWRPEARGLLSGLTRGTTRAHIARAALEGIAFQVSDLLDVMARDLGAPLEVLRVDGGAASNDLLMQFQADVIGVTCARPGIVDTTALGAAFLAALGVGIFSSLDDVRASWWQDRSIEPSIDASTRARRLEGWHDALRRV